MTSSSHCAKRCFQGSRSNFSIDHILNVAGGRQSSKNVGFAKECATEDKRFEWLNCTRYRPPKLPRQGKREGIQRRKSGRNPRIPFSSSQVAFLEAKFLRTPYLSSAEVTKLASHLKLSETRHAIHFAANVAKCRVLGFARGTFDWSAHLETNSHTNPKVFFFKNFYLRFEGVLNGSEVSTS